MPLPKRLFLAAALAATPAVAAEQKPSLADLAPIPLQAGLNTIQGFTPEGEAGQVVMAWRGNGNAWGYHLFLVMVGSEVAGFDNLGQGDDGQFDDTIRDSPHTQEDVIRSIRFMRGKVDGKPATLVFSATRAIDPEEGVPGPALIDFTVYRLVSGDDDVGTTRYRFEPILAERSKDKACHADKALLRQFGIPLPEDYAGPDTADGC